MSKIMTLMNELIELISMGPFGSDIKVDNFINDGVPVLNGSNVSSIKLTETSFKYVSPQKAKELKKANAKRGDIIITHRGTVGQISYIPENSKYDNYVISQSQFRVTLKRNLVDPIYFTYYFHTDEGQKRLLSFKSHVGVPALAQATTNFRLLEFPLIPLATQQKIAKVLSDLDAKIELNNKINAELEVMAKTLYDYWFVKFDFPDANGKPYKTSGGKMVWNEELKREIPEGWDVKELSDIANITMGQSPPGESYNEEGLGTVFYQGCTDFGNRFPKIRKYTTSPTRFARQGDILLSVRAPVGTMNIAKENCCIGRGLASLNSKDNCIAYLFGVMVNLKQIFDRRNVDGTTFGSITKDDLFSLKVLKPSNAVLLEFDKIVNPCFQKQNKLEEENIQHASLRDWLLPMLMNGQVSVGEVAKEYQFVEEVLGMVAEPRVINFTPQDKKVRRKMLATYIVNQSLSDTSFGKTKFEKLLHLVEYHLVKNDFNQRYSVQTAGPYDGGFTKVFWDEVTAAKWFKFEELGNLKRVVAGENHEKSLKEYDFFSDDLKQSIRDFITLFNNSNYEKAEIVSTLYAVWNNRLINNELVNDALLKNDFIAWDKQKARYMDQLDAALVWMRKENIVPDGWGKYISRAKSK